MERGSGPKRTGGPKRSAEGARRWQERSRQRARERAAEQAKRPPLRPGHRRGGGKRKVTVPRIIRARAMNRTYGACFVCLHREGLDPEDVTIEALRRLVSRAVVRRAVHLHHVLDEAKFPKLAKLLENLAGVCFDCHEAHHFQPNGRIPREALPACALELAEREGLTWYIERTYPLGRDEAEPVE